MNRWRKTLLTSVAVVTIGGLTLGAGTVLGGGKTRGEHDGIWISHASGGSWLGVVIDEVSGDEAERLDMDSPMGALVTSVEEDSPADKAGIREGDVIVEYDGERISGVRELVRLVRETPAGRTVDVDLIRDGRRVSVRADIEERSSEPKIFSWRGPGDEDSDIQIDIPDMDIRIPHIRRIVGRPLLGVAIDSLNPQLAEYFGVREKDGGVFIKEVYEDSPAERAGLKAGDVILEADGRKIDGVMDLREVLRKNAGETVDLLIVRDKSRRTIEVTLDEDDGDWEDGRLHRRMDLEHRELERALREAQRHKREAVRLRRERLRDVERRVRERLIVEPARVIGKSSAVEI